MNRFHRWFCRTSFWKKALANEIIPWALKDVELGDDVLEVGPGPGMATDILRERLGSRAGQKARRPARPLAGRVDSKRRGSSRAS